MGNAVSRSEILRLVEEGPDYIFRDKWVWTSDQRNLLLRLVNSLGIVLQGDNPELPWHDDRTVLDDYLAKVILTVPKSSRMEDIYNVTGGPDLFGKKLSELQLRTIVELGHLYAGVLFLWLLRKKNSESSGLNSIGETFYQTDLLDYVYREPRNGKIEVDHSSQLQTVRALERVVVVSSVSVVPSGYLIYCSEPVRVVFGKIAGDGTRLSPGLYFTETEVSLGPFMENNELERLSEQIVALSHDEEKCGRCFKQGAVGRHILRKMEACVESSSSCTESSSSDDEISVQCSSSSEVKPRRRSVEGYLREILWKLNSLCEANGIRH